MHCMTRISQQECRGILEYGGQIRMKAIIYTSNTGSTAEYAQLLGKGLNLPVHSLQQAKNKVLSGSEIIYLGWIMAGGIKGYKEAAKLYKVRAVCGIGMGQTGTQLKEVRDKNAILKPPERDWQIKPTVRPKRMIC